MNDPRKLRDTFVAMWQSQMVSKHWQAAEWSNKGDVAGSARDVHRKINWGGTGLEPEGEIGLSGRNLCGWGNRAWGVQMNVATQGALPFRFPGSSNTVGAFFSGVKGQLVRKLLTPNHVSFEGELSISLVLNPGDNLSHKWKYRRSGNAKSRIEAITVPWKRWNILHLDHCRRAGENVLSQGQSNFIDCSGRLENERWWGRIFLWIKNKIPFLLQTFNNQQLIMKPLLLVCSDQALDIATVQQKQTTVWLGVGGEGLSMGDRIRQMMVNLHPPPGGKGRFSLLTEFIAKQFELIRKDLEALIGMRSEGFSQREGSTPGWGNSRGAGLGWSLMFQN